MHIGDGHVTFHLQGLHLLEGDTMTECVPRLVVAIHLEGAVPVK